MDKDQTGVPTTVRVPGLHWNSDSDILKLALAKLIEDILLLLRYKQTYKVYQTFSAYCCCKLLDPRGWTEPFIVKSKILMQQLWKERINWDEELTETFKGEWKTWINNIQELQTIEIQRKYFNSVHINSELYIFCDSSKKAYGTVAYLMDTTKQEHRAAFVMAKRRVAPIKSTTRPRMELHAALLGVRLTNYIAKTLELKIGQMEIFLWSDTKIVLSWLPSRTRLPSFV